MKIKTALISSIKRCLAQSAQWRHIMFLEAENNVEERGNVILDPHPESDQQWNLTTSRESPLAIPTKVWSTSINTSMSYLQTDRQTDRQTHTHTHVIRMTTIPVPSLYTQRDRSRCDGVHVLAAEYSVSMHSSSSSSSQQRLLINLRCSAAAAVAGRYICVKFYVYMYVVVSTFVTNYDVCSISRQTSYECIVFRRETTLGRLCKPLILRLYDEHTAVAGASNTQHSDLYASLQKRLSRHCHL